MALTTGTSRRDNDVFSINEPDGHWNWLGPKQEGSPATNREVAHVVRELNKALIKNKMQTRILVNESSDYRCLLGTHETDWQRGYEINSFFSKDSTKTYLGNQKQVLPLIGGHSYWTNTPIPYMRDVRMQLREACRQKGIKFWQTETCIMGNDEEIGGGVLLVVTTGMDSCVFIAKMVGKPDGLLTLNSYGYWVTTHALSVRVLSAMTSLPLLQTAVKWKRDSMILMA